MSGTITQLPFGIIKGQRYGNLSYDIPKAMDDLAELIRRKIRPYALMVNESNYLIPWQNRDAILEIVKEAQLIVNENRRAEKRPEVTKTNVRCLLIDETNTVEVLDWAKERMDEIVEEVKDSFRTRMGAVIPKIEKLIDEKKLDVNDKAKEISSRKRAILRDLKKRVEDAEKTFVWFSMSDQVRSALKASVNLFEAEIAALKQVAMLGGTPVKQEQVPGTVPSKEDAEKALFG